jgi:hypothetical protein
MASHWQSVRVINRQAIERLSREEIERHRGEYAVFVDGRIESYHATNGEALEAACARHSFGEFSVQRIEQLIELSVGPATGRIKTPSARLQ